MEVFKQAGFKVTKGDAWSVLWGRPAELLTEDVLRALGPFQRINHFPGTWELGRKDSLYRNVAAARRLKGAAFDFIPKYFLLPGDAGAFQSELEHYPGKYDFEDLWARSARQPRGSCHPPERFTSDTGRCHSRRVAYILKPVASSRGRGVRVVADPRSLDLTALEECLLQRYITDPFLIDGYKFDLRVYVAVTSLDPLRVYVHEEGLVRFATQRYSSSSASYRQRRRHLTNYAVNKGHAGGATADGGAAAQHGISGDGEGELDATVGSGGGQGGDEGRGGARHCPKWSLAMLRRHLEARGHDWGHVWEQVKDIAAKTLIAAEPRMGACTRAAVRHRNCCFELFGLDVMLDSSLRAWLLEVNTTPSLAVDSPLDERVKGSVVADLM
ncbi:Tubulin polyglutamylase TTLL5 [Monoraphidium neglectum]|uniref:Tubulin--tyrosine ligase-like protein 5 n=1 Tax=Monoraphidium neglectum TaxID=145388 RepID=A0A0D2MPF1_9CHLO|nr:Tubulin polyglutamylase TTLL5 [Monoraphidium neglectum]KIY96565.1 Tubulin polyglutamylase TTLL5 [Monoraphidium neglectum]|eukprot:XP_013895585.1 Tubulin polyglutamylase TTLL5 [Monoraphidium neglectum]